MKTPDIDLWSQHGRTHTYPDMHMHTHKHICMHILVRVSHIEFHERKVISSYYKNPENYYIRGDANKTDPLL